MKDYFALLFLVISLQTICQVKVTLGQPNDDYNPFLDHGTPFDTKGFDDMFSNGGTLFKGTSSIFNNNFQSGKLFDTDSSLTKTSEFPSFKPLFNSNNDFPSMGSFPKLTTKSAFSAPLMSPFPSAFKSQLPKHFSSFPSIPSLGHSSESDESHVHKITHTKTRKTHTIITSHTIYPSSGSLPPPIFLAALSKPIVIKPVANHNDHSDDCDCDDKPGKQSSSLPSIATIATTSAAGAAFSSGLKKKPPQTGIQIPITEGPHTATAEQSKIDDKSGKYSQLLQNGVPLAAAAAAGAALSSGLKKKPPQTGIPITGGPTTATAEQLKKDEDKCNWCLRTNCNPGGCQEVANFDAKKDAKNLHDALKGKQLNEQLIINILTHRSDKQRKRIIEEYQEFASSLRKDVEKSNLKSKEFLAALLLPRDVFFAKELHKAFKEGSGDYEAMIMMLTSLTPCAVKKVGVAYYQRYGSTLADDIKGASNLNFEDFLVELCRGSRQPDGPVDEAAAAKDAKALADAGPNKFFGSDKKVFIDIFTHRSYSQLREIIKKYNAMSKHNIRKDIEENTSDKLQKGLLAMLKNVQNQPGYFADELEGSLNKLLGSGVANKDMLVRIMRGRCGVDLGDIRDAYPKNHDGKKLVDMISSQTDKTLKEALVEMLKGSNSQASQAIPDPSKRRKISYRDNIA